MPASQNPIFPNVPYAKCLSGASNAFTACTTRAPTATASLAGANIVEFVSTSTNGRRIDKIQVNASASAIGGATAANVVMIWLWDGTTAFLTDEIPITAQTPSATAASFQTSKTYTNLVLPAAWKLYVAVGVTTVDASSALTIQAFGGDY